MKYDITFSCGHTHTVDIYGSAAERERKVMWYETQAVCPDCYKAQMDAEAAEGCDEVEMSYKEYKTDYADCKTKRDSYNKETKTIVVYVPRTETEEEIVEAAKSAYAARCEALNKMIKTKCGTPEYAECRAEYMDLNAKYVDLWQRGMDCSLSAGHKLLDWSAEYARLHGGLIEI